MPENKKAHGREERNYDWPNTTSLLLDLNNFSNLHVGFGSVITGKTTDETPPHLSCGDFSSFLICLSGPPGLAEEIRSLNLEEFSRLHSYSIMTSWMSAAVDLIPLTFLLSGPLPLQTTLSPPWRLNLMMIGWMSGLRGSNRWRPAGWVELLPTKWPLWFPHHSRRHLFVLKLQLPSITQLTLTALIVWVWGAGVWLSGSHRGQEGNEFSCCWSVRFRHGAPRIKVISKCVCSWYQFFINAVSLQTPQPLQHVDPQI